MRKLGAAVEQFFFPAREIALEARLYQVLTLTTAFVTLAVIIPVNFAQNVSPRIAISTGLLGVISLLLSVQERRRGERYPALFCALVLLVVNAIYFVAGGARGVIPMFFFIVPGLAMVFFRGWKRLVLVVLVLIDAIALILAEYFRPSLVEGWESARDKLTDLATGLPVAVVTSSLIFWSVVDSYLRTQRNLVRANEELERNLNEILTLRDLVPVCAWCRKVRTDEGQWLEARRYLASRRDVVMTDAFCIECSGAHGDASERPRLDR